jgi:DNA-binding MarR family transcriptional regulator
MNTDFNLYELYSRVVITKEAFHAQSALTRLEYLLLLELFGEKGSLSQVRLAEEACVVDASNTHRVCKRMESEGWVQFDEGPKGSPVKLMISITPKGRKFLYNDLGFQK